MSAVMTQVDNKCVPVPANPIGRPSKYNTRTLRRTKEYINSEVDKIPTMAGLARHLNVTRDTIYHWINTHKCNEFSDTISMMADERERQLINKGLDGKFNSNIAKLILTTSHGYSDKDQQDTGITVNVNRDSVQISTRGQTLEVKPDK